MKTIKILSLVLFTSLMMACGSTDSKTTASTNENNDHQMIKVWGNCGMCKKTIEGSIAGLEGLSVGEWDVEKKVLHVEFDKTQTSVEAISKAVASSGYDTEFHTASDEAYNGLHSCCQYDRK